MVKTKLEQYQYNGKAGASDELQIQVNYYKEMIFCN